MALGGPASGSALPCSGDCGFASAICPSGFFHTRIPRIATGWLGARQFVSAVVGIVVLLGLQRGIRSQLRSSVPRTSKLTRSKADGVWCLVAVPEPYRPLSVAALSHR